MNEHYIKASDLEVPIYDLSRNHTSKRLNLAFRADVLYAWKYLPKIIDFGAFEGVKNAMEVGAGYGSKLRHAVRMFPDINFRAIEQSSQMILKGKQYYPEIAHLVEQGDARFLDGVQDKSQDLLMYYQVLHHLDWEGLEDSLKQAHRVLSPGGKIVIIETFLNDNNTWFGTIKKTVFNISEPVYALISTTQGADAYNIKPQQAFSNCVEDHGFKLTYQFAPFGKFAVSEIMVFEKI